MVRSGGAGEKAEVRAGLLLRIPKLRWQRKKKRNKSEDAPITNYTFRRRCRTGSLSQFFFRALLSG